MGVLVVMLRRGKNMLWWWVVAVADWAASEMHLIFACEEFIYVTDAGYRG